MKRTAIAAGLTGFALGFGLATAGLPPPAGAEPRLERTGDGPCVFYDGAADERGNGAADLGGPPVGGGGADVLHTGPDPAPEGRSATPPGGGAAPATTHAEPAGAAAARRG